MTELLVEFSASAYLTDTHVSRLKWIPRKKAVPAKVLEELTRLKALYNGFGSRELSQLLWHKTHERVDDQTVHKLGTGGEFCP